MYTTETTHYGIPLPLGTDLTTPMDYNEAAEAIDTAVWQAASDSATANENAAAAVETAGTVAEGLESLGATVTDHGNRITALAARMTNAENEIDDVRADSQDMITAFKEATATSTHAYAIGDYFIYNNVLYKATVVIAIGDTIVPNTNCSATNITNELPNIADHDNTKLNSIGIAADYNNTATYEKGDFCTRNGNFLKANQDISTPEEFNGSHWNNARVGDILKDMVIVDSVLATLTGGATFENKSQDVSKAGYIPLAVVGWYQNWSNDLAVSTNNMSGNNAVITVSNGSTNIPDSSNVRLYVLYVRDI